MADTAGVVRGWCDKGELPPSEVLFSTLTDESGLFNAAEGACWDFKDQWPFSHSDNYFGGICRLVCAFANTWGGLIVFGVHDSKRDGGHNKVQVNLDRFRQAFLQLTEIDLPFSIAGYQSERSGGVDVLMVPPRPAGTSPLRFLAPVGRYKAGTIWVRSGHEVQQATPAHFPVLFCRGDAAYSQAVLAELDGSIPPSPATVKKFVGRVEVLDDLFTWLQNSDEPRTYLCGKGGSGKTTIAHEFARLVKDYGGNIRIFGGDSVDIVVFLSAKEKYLQTPDLKIGELSDPDFSDEQSLLRQLLIFGSWTTDIDALDSMDLKQLRKEAADFFDLSSCLIVIDDIDTLTTKGVDPGSDYLYRTLSRSKRNSKVVYTLRNVPSQSITNSIEVPGLKGADYESFVGECAAQFGVPEPTEDFRDVKLVALSESRPLVIEAIIALKRTSGSYDQAAQLFEQHAGDDVREYVFKREWDALPTRGAERALLAALSDFNEPTSFADLQAVLRVDASIVRDAVSAVREMFFNIDDAGSETLYALAPLTRSFVTSRKHTLSDYPVLRERIKAFRRSVTVSNPRVANLVLQVERLIPSRFDRHSPDKVLEAWRVVSDKTLPPAVTEAPLFKTLFGYVAVCAAPPRLMEAREAFEYAWTMSHEAEFRYLRNWIEAEKNSGVDDGLVERIADHIIDGKSYTERDKIEMIGRKASSLYVRGRNRLVTDTVDALKDLESAVKLHLRAYRLNADKDSFRADNSKAYAENTAFTLFDVTIRGGEQLDIVEQFKRIIAAKEIYADPIALTFLDGLGLLEDRARRPEQIHPLRNRLRGLADEMSVKDRWRDDRAARDAVENIRQIDRDLAAKLRAR